MQAQGKESINFDTRVQVYTDIRYTECKDSHICICSVITVNGVLEAYMQGFIHWGGGGGGGGVGGWGEGHGEKLPLQTP